MLTTDFLASAGWPHLTENEALRKLVKALDPRYDLLSVGKVQRLLLPTLKNEIILSIKDRLRKAATRRVSITLNMWSHSGPTHAGPSVYEMLQRQAVQALGRGQKEGAVGEGSGGGAVGEGSGGGAEGGGSRAVAVEAGTEEKEKGTATALYAEAQQNGDRLNQPIRRCMTDSLYTTVAKFNAQVKEGDVLRMVFMKKKNAVKSKKEEVDHTEAKPNVSLFGKVMKRTTTHTTIRWLGFQNNLTCLLPLAQRNWADKLVKVHEKQIVAYETDPRVRYPAFDRFATGDMLYDWDILDVNHERLQHAPDPERRKAATTFPVGVEQFQKGKGKGNGGAADSAGGGAAPAGPGGRTNLKPKEAAADANAEKAGGKLPPPEKVITPGEEGYRPLYIHLQHKGLVVGPGAAQRVAELTNSGCLAAQKQDGSNTNSNSKRVRGSPSHPVVISPQPNRSPGAPTPGKPKSQRKSSQQLPPPIDSIHIEESDHEEEEKEVP
eukprot:Cvel_8319.t2-p1 / transcript=Cvel_8319.t2 / gene=Cvel_8319 / organism=Chromera_velia_CCMP2878 / gene_product=hypothetical protein / transcript_product=hypothetical protein / location=Cvel_scaffold457:32398-34107(+) / protein_length=491 / sequence_SO=supercontig / SO=protein_coding / is_pseudo=false